MGVINELYGKKKKELDMLITAYKVYLTGLLNQEIEDYVKMIDASETDKEKKELREVRRLLTRARGLS